ncbi:alpha/beta hydrolase [Polaribacter sp.]|uniref:alpha/beta hydrolase n=1 Tax=Polaribacter sp. TaxID=1920175 RepID=UPI003EF6D8AB
MKIFTSIVFILLCNFSFAQTIYLDSVAKVSKRTFTYKKSKEEKLKLDFYKPKKLSGEYPLLIFVHGGGFSGGKRDGDNIKYFAKQMANRGYAVASISYRLTMKNLGFGCQTKAADKINAFNSASEDISLAVKYILEKNKKFKINTKKIILIGSSAGAEAILNLAYNYENKILPKDFKFAGVVSMAGATVSVDNLTAMNAIPTQLFHGIADKLVPYNIAPHHYCNKNDSGYLMLYGSKAIANKLKELGEPYYLYSVKDGGHSWANIPMNNCTEQILDFLYFDVLQEKKRQTEIYN